MSTFNIFLSKNVNVYCICLPSRKKHVEMFFSRLNIYPIYPEVITRKELRDIGVEELRKSGIIDSTFTPDSDGDFGKIACGLSHINTLKTFLKSDRDIALIFEDDNNIPLDSEVDTIYNRFENVINQLEMIKDWEFCNLSPCWSPYNKKVSSNLYTGKLGACFNAYLVRKEGAIKLIKTLPFTSRHKALDGYLSELYNKYYPYKAFEVHPRLFRQKDNHVLESMLNNKNGTPEFNTSRKYIIILKVICIVVYTIFIYIMYTKTHNILILILGIIGLMLYYLLILI